MNTNKRVMISSVGAAVLITGVVLWSAYFAKMLHERWPGETLILVGTFLIIAESWSRRYAKRNRQNP